MSRFATLERLVIGYNPPNLVSHLICPEIPAPGNPFKVKTWGPELFRHFSTKRAKMADSNFATTKAPGDITITLEPRDLVKGFDKEWENTEDQSDMTANLAIEAKGGVMLDLEIDNAKRLFDASNYPDGNKETLSGGDQFSSYETSKPVVVVDEAKSVVNSKIGYKPNTLVIPDDVYNMIKWHPDLKMFSTITGQDSPATIEYLKQKFEVSNIIIGDGQYYDELTAAFKPIWSMDMLLLYVNPNPKPTQFEKSFAYRFRLKGYPIVDDPPNYDTQKFVKRRYNEMCDDIIVCAQAGYLIKNAILKS